MSIENDPRALRLLAEVRAAEGDAVAVARFEAQAAALGAPPALVFVAAAPGDEAATLDLEQHLAPLVRRGAVTVWHNGRIGPGENVAESSARALVAARCVVLLLTARFLASDACLEDVRDALLRQGRPRLLPILVAPCAWHQEPALAGLQVLPRDGAPVGASPSRWVEVADAVRAVAAVDRCRPPADPPPEAYASPALREAWTAGWLANDREWRDHHAASLARTRVALQRLARERQQKEARQGFLAGGACLALALVSAWRSGTSTVTLGLGGLGVAALLGASTAGAPPAHAWRVKLTVVLALVLGSAGVVLWYWMTAASKAKAVICFVFGALLAVMIAVAWRAERRRRRPPRAAG